MVHRTFSCVCLTAALIAATEAPGRPEPAADPPTEARVYPAVADWRGDRWVILSDAQGRPLPILVGPNEAMAITLALSGQKTPRPLTHDLMLYTLTELGWRVSKVRLSKLADTTYYATLVLTDGAKEKQIDARASDAINLALRAKCPIRVPESVWAAGIRRDAAGTPLSMAELLEQLQEPTDVVSELLTPALAGGSATLTVEPDARARVEYRQGETRRSGLFEGEAYRLLVQRLMKLAGPPETAVEPQQGEFDYEHAGRRYRVTVKATPAAPLQTLSVEVKSVAP